MPTANRATRRAPEQGKPPIVPATRKEVAEVMRCSDRTVDVLAMEGVLTKYKVGSLVRFDMNEVQDVLRASATA